MSETQPKTIERNKDDDASANDHNHHGHKRRRKKRSKRHKYTVEQEIEKKIEGGSFHTNNNNIPGAELQLDNEVTNRNSFTSWSCHSLLSNLSGESATLRVDIRID